MQSVPITTNAVSSNPANGEVYSIQHYVIKFARDLIQHYVIKFARDLIQHYVIKFARDLRHLVVFSVSSTNKTDRHAITEILLKVAFKIITLTQLSS